MMPDFIDDLRRQHRDRLAALTHLHHDAETGTHLAADYPVRVAKTHEGKVVAWPRWTHAPDRRAILNFYPRVTHAPEGPGGVGVVQPDGERFTATVFRDRSLRAASGTSEWFDTEAEALAHARRLALTRPVLRKRLARADKPKPTTLQPITDAPKTSEELKALGVRHTLTADGRPKVSQADLTRALNDLGRAATAGMSTARREEHLLAAGAHDLSSGVHGPGGRAWYGDHVREMEHGFHRMFGYPEHRDHPSQVFAKVLIGLTSPNASPNQNVDTAVRMLKAGGGDVMRIPAANDPALHEWLDEMADTHREGLPHHKRGGGPVGTDPHDLGRWAHEHGLFGKTASYYGVPALYDPRKRRVAKVLKKGGWQDVRPEWGYEPFDPRLSPVHLPFLDERGAIQAKRWTSFSPSMWTGLKGLQRMIAKHGREKTAAFLTGEHDPKVVDDARKEFVSPSGKVYPEYMPPGEKLAGFLALGPDKTGPFTANMHDNAKFGKYLTADVWFARWYRRHLGALRGNKEPISPPQRKKMYETARRLATQLGVKSVADLQASLWLAEQALYRSYHQNAPTGTLLEATKQAMARNFGLKSASGTTREESRGLDE